ncbi:MAG: KpsF/GutQ family sugar-phosphate isomerase [Planctomycetota bacterium]|jgi:arabinose-5-phosphate isomerase
MEPEDILKRGREIIETEAAAIRATGAKLGDHFVRLVRTVLESRGKVLTSGVGKSGIVAKKIAATLSSTGTPSFYLNPVNALHGDLGIAGVGDLLVALSNSGETEELLNLVHAARDLQIKVAALCGAPDSTLVQHADFFLDVGVTQEACPLGLAPTASTSAAIATGDALAMVLMEARSFQPRDFARLHPAGTLRGRLQLKVQDIMRAGERIPVVDRNAPLSQALKEMTAKEIIGVTLVTDRDGCLAGILTDGDLRRILQKSNDLAGVLSHPVEEFMTPNPKVVEAQALASEALRIMEVKGITSLAIVDGRGRPAGIIHLHDVLGRGKFSV